MAKWSGRNFNQWNDDGDKPQWAQWQADSTDAIQSSAISPQAFFMQMLDRLNTGQWSPDSRWGNIHNHHHHHNHNTDTPPTTPSDPTAPPPPPVTGGTVNNPPPTDTGGTTDNPPPTGTGGTTDNPPPTDTGGTTDNPPPTGTGGTTDNPPPTDTGGTTDNPPPIDTGGSSDTPPPPAPPPPPPPANLVGTVSISAPNGKTEGKTLTANATDGDNFDPAAVVTYHWQDDVSGSWQNIGTGKTHVIGFDEGTHQIRVLADYTDGAGNAEAPMSAPIGADDVNRLGTLTVTSTAGFVEGSTVTASVTDPDGIGSDILYQWSSAPVGSTNWQPINGAIHADYLLTAADAGKQIDVIAHYTDLQGHNDTAADPFTVDALPPPPPPVTDTGDHMMIGVNLPQATFGQTVPGLIDNDYTYPTHADIDYYASKGMEVIRLGFDWERLQLSPNAPLNSTELARMDDIVNYATSNGLKVDLDMHNFGRAFGSGHSATTDGQIVGQSNITSADFADFWGKMAAHYANNPDIIYGIMNEPHDENVQGWIDTQNQAIAAIRAAGGTQEILVSSPNWDSAAAFVSSGIAAQMLNGVHDPLNNFAYEVHAYFDSDGSGTHPAAVSSTIGVERITAITQWAEANHKTLFLGEFGFGSDSTSMAAVDNMLNYMQQHQGVWQGATVWAGGPWWGNLWYSVEPTGLGTSNVTDKPQMTLLDEHIAQINAGIIHA